jgi:hypothetical protein
LEAHEPTTLAQWGQDADEDKDGQWTAFRLRDTRQNSVRAQVRVARAGAVSHDLYNVCYPQTYRYRNGFVT